MAVVLTEMEETCRRIGRTLGAHIDEEFGDKKVGFCLLMFDFGEGGHLTYISNAKRMDMIKALDEFKERLQKEVN